MSTERENHPPESLLEAYSFGRVPETEVASLEEHLLVCEACRERLGESDAYIRAMRRASARAQKEKPRAGLWGIPRLVPALAAAVMVLGIGVTLLMNQKRTLAPVTVALEATRGGGVVAQIPEGKPLLLRPSLDGLPSFPQYHLEIVDRTGTRIWQGNFAPATGAGVPSQPSGLYFVRLYSIPGALLREYAMEIKTAASQ